MAPFRISTILPVFGSGVAVGIMGVGVHTLAVNDATTAVWISGLGMSVVQATKTSIGKNGNRRLNIGYLPVFTVLYTR
jgi:hypothetical protein